MSKFDENFRWDAYKFLIKPWRDSDEQGVLERFVNAVQQTWEDTQSSIDALSELHNIDEIPDEYLKYLKWHLGWTSELDVITSGLTPDELRKLIRVSASIWKQKGTSRGLRSTVRFLTGSSSILWNWFHFRWLTDVGSLWFTLGRGDSWIVGNDYGQDDEYLSILFVKNTNNLNKQLIRDIVNLHRPVNETFLLVFPDFIDEFQDGLLNWEQNGVAEATWNEGNNSATVVPDSQLVAIIDDLSKWDQAYLMLQVVVSDPTQFITIEFMRIEDGTDCLLLKYSIAGVELYSRTAGVDTLIDSSVPTGWIVGSKAAIWVKVTNATSIQQRVEMGVGVNKLIDNYPSAGTYHEGGFSIINDGISDVEVDRVVGYGYPTHHTFVSGPGVMSAPPEPLYDDPYQTDLSILTWAIHGAFWHTTTYKKFIDLVGSFYFGAGETGYEGTGVAGDYITGSPTDGDITSDPIDLSAFNPSTQSVSISWYQYQDLRPEDVCELIVLVGGTPVQTFHTSATEGYNEVPLDSSILGEASVEFRFMVTVTIAQAGSEEGWFVDGVRLMIRKN